MTAQLAQMTSAIQIHEFSGHDEQPLLNEISAILESKDCLFFRPAWNHVFRVYGLRYRLWTARRDQKLVGVLPAVEQRSPVTGRQLVSLPWFDCAGLVTADSDAEVQLVQQAVNAAREAGLGLVQLRQRQQSEISSYVRTDKVLMRLRLEKTPEELWKRLNPKVRNQVRKAEKAGVSVKFGGPELLDDFFRIYSENMRDLGSPSHSLKFFHAIFKSFPGEASLALALHGTEPVGAGFTLANGACLEIPWASSLRKYNSFCVNHGMYWKILERACTQGFDWFHFGRSTIDSGTYHFKKQWGAEADQLYWYFLGDDKRASQAAAPPEHDHGLAVKIWRKLPLFVSRAVGPRLISQIP